ncbi:MAG: hypothetical protein P4L75_03655 [Clostridia bacterium]|nr:hypothetical protein [Clostridia bacterium]MDR3644883.1 hypothetical protein [Clostridia bacterium]
MATIADYLTKLNNLRNSLADNLTAKGVTGSHTDTMDTLVPRVLDIRTSLTGKPSVSNSLVVGQVLSVSNSLSVCIPAANSVNGVVG